MNNHLVYKIKVPIYHGRLFVVFTNDIDSANADLQIDPSFASNGCAACALHAVKGGANHYYALFSKTPDITQLVHEAVHIVNYIFMDKGIKLDLNNDEPQAYLTGWVMGEIYKAMYKFGLFT